MAQFGDWLKQARESRGMTLEVFADKVGTTHPTISRYEKNRQNPKRSTVKKIAEALGVDSVPALIAAGYLPDKNEEPTMHPVNEEIIIPDGATIRIRLRGGDLSEPLNVDLKTLALAQAASKIFGKPVEETE